MKNQSAFLKNVVLFFPFLFILTERTMEKNQLQRINCYTKATEIRGENALTPPFSSVVLSALELVPSVFRFPLSSIYKYPSKDLI